LKCCACDKGADVNAKDNNGDTALMEASRKDVLMKAHLEGHLELVRLLLDKGADVNAKDNNGDTALMQASRKGHLDVVRALLDKGADVNAKNNNGDTALNGASKMASRKSDLEVVRVLLDKGADVNAKNKNGDTALNAASATEVVTMLLGAGAKDNRPLCAKDGEHLWMDGKCFYCRKVRRDSWGSTDLHLAIRNGASINIIRDLCRNSLLNVGDETGFTPLMEASGPNGNLEVVKLLLSMGADINAESTRGVSALSMAALHGKGDVIEYLKNNGAKVGFVLRSSNR
jgi:ankyrin repeat protein